MGKVYGIYRERIEETDSIRTHRWLNRDTFEFQYGLEVRKAPKPGGKPGPWAHLVTADGPVLHDTEELAKQLITQIRKELKKGVAA